MNARELESYYVFRKVQMFLDQWAALFPMVTASALRLQFDALVERLAMFVARQHEQEHVRRGGAHHVGVLRTELIEDHIEPIIAIGVILEATLPQLRLRAPREDGSVAALCTRANALAKTVEPFAAKFIALGLPADFLEQLRAAAQALDVASTTHGMTEAMAVGATSGVAATVKEANQHMRAIATLIRKEMRARPEMVAEWEKLRRLPSHQSRGIARGVNRPALPSAPKPLLLAAPEASSESDAPSPGVPGVPGVPGDATDVPPMDTDFSGEGSSVDVVQGRAPRRLWVKATRLLGGG